ncbi:MAG: hypothetical protein EOM20_09345 [Spartobacteria bacterium]|nr:hypothetical protein [Spartobacteria bacterium]
MKDDEGITFTIEGKPALIIIVLLLAFFVWRLLATSETVDPAVEKCIRNVLSAEYARSLLPAIRQSVDNQDDEAIQEQVERLTTYGKRITFRSLCSRDGGTRLIVRAEILVDGKPPPLGKPVRYFQINHFPLLGYTYDMEATVLDYYLPFMD